MTPRDLSDAALRVLRAVAVHGPITIPELDALPREMGGRPKNTVAWLWRHDLVEVTGTGGASAHAYSCTDKGKRLLALADAPPAPGQVAAPRERAIGGKWRPTVHTFVPRPGSMRAFELPSVVNGEEVARKRPAIMSVTRVERTPR